MKNQRVKSEIRGPKLSVTENIGTKFKRIGIWLFKYLVLCL
jgi:hypothetical protein